MEVYKLVCLHERISELKECLRTGHDRLFSRLWRQG